LVSSPPPKSIHRSCSIGTSLGGELAFMYAQAYPADVAGFIAINPMPPPFNAWMAAAKKVETPQEIQTLELPDYLGQNPERVDSQANSSMLTRTLPSRMPYAILFDENCGGDTAFCSRILIPLSNVEAGLARVGSAGQFMWVKGAGHEIESTRPDTVISTFDMLWAQLTR
jgi:pimeloyl-ACP methyl ester carboxylesterase